MGCALCAGPLSIMAITACRWASAQITPFPDNAKRERYADSSFHLALIAPAPVKFTALYRPASIVLVEPSASDTLTHQPHSKLLYFTRDPTTLTHRKEINLSIREILNVYALSVGNGFQF